MLDIHTYRKLATGPRNNINLSQTLYKTEDGLKGGGGGGGGGGGFGTEYEFEKTENLSLCSFFR